MKDKLILFSHHFVDDFVKWNFENVKKLNSNWDIIPIGFSGKKLMDGSIVLDVTKYSRNIKLLEFVPQYNEEWASPDLFCYEGYSKFPNYNGYFLYEYDTICNVSIEKFFNINVDFFGNNINYPADESWEWSKLYRKHNRFNHNFDVLYGYGQSTCIWFKNDILKKCYEEILKNKHLYNDMFCEVRGGTLTNKFTKIKKSKETIRDYIWWNTDGLKFERNEYFFHPIKNFKEYYAFL